MFCGVSLGWDVSLCNKKLFFMNYGGTLQGSSKWYPTPIGLFCAVCMTYKCEWSINRLFKGYGPFLGPTFYETIFLV